MQSYPVRRGHVKKTDLKVVFEKFFGSTRESDGWLLGSFGAMPRIRAHYKGSDALDVDTESNRAADAETTLKTIKAWNEFLEAATGYTAKNRAKKAQAAAKKGERF